MIASQIGEAEAEAEAETALSSRLSLPVVARLSLSLSLRVACRQDSFKASNRRALYTGLQPSIQFSVYFQHPARQPWSVLCR